MQKEHSFLSMVTSSPAPLPGNQLGENKWEDSIPGVALNEVDLVLPGFLRNFREIHRGQINLLPTGGL